MFKLWERYDFKKYRWSIFVLIILICTAGIYVLAKVQGEEEVDMVSSAVCFWPHLCPCSIIILSVNLRA